MVLHSVPSTIGMISTSISNAQSIVGVTVGVGVGVGSIVSVGVIDGVIDGVGVFVGIIVFVGVGVTVFVGVTVAVIDGVTVFEGVTVIVGVGVCVTKVSQSIIMSLDNELLVQGESNLIVTCFVPTVLYCLNALWQSVPEQTPSTPIEEVVPSPQSIVKLISPTAAIPLKLVILVTVTLLQSTS